MDSYPFIAPRCGISDQVERGIFRDLRSPSGSPSRGVLSTDLYKLYGNNLFERLQMPGVGAHIREISCVAPACADDLLLLSDRKDALQSLVNIAVDHSCLEHYLLQPVKSVLLEILLGLKAQDLADASITMKEQNMPMVQQTMHVGILRSANSQESAEEENIRKARRAIYGLMAAGHHGEKGLDQETSIQLIHTYVLPVLVYGLEVILTNRTFIDKLERVYRPWQQGCICIFQNFSGKGKNLLIFLKNPYYVM